jgi:hypothetical protein
MSIFRSAYDTKACEGFAVDKLLAEIKKSMTMGWLSPVPETSILRVDGADALSAGIPSFMHPIVLENRFDGMPSPSLQLAIDARPFGKWDQHQRQFAVRNGVEYDLLVFRAKLNQIWISHPAQILRDVSSLPMSVYCSWISENVARRFALDPLEQMKLAILTGFFYQSNFTDLKELQERDTIRMVQAIVKATRAKAEDVLDVVDQFSAPISGVKEFCEKAQEVTGSVRLHELNIGVLAGILSKTWFGGPNAAELLFVALEHPPTWLTIMMAAATERTFKNSQITKIAERQSMAANKQFVQALVNLVNVTSGK